MKKINQKLAVRWLPKGKTLNGEEVILFLRRHWFVLLSKFALLTLLSVLPIVVYFLIDNLFPNLFASSGGYAVLILFGSLYYLFIWISLFTTFLDYYLDVWIVTTQRIIDREQKGLFHVTISEQSLEQIQDVSSNVEGVIPTLLEFGDVLIQSAGAKNLFHFKQIHDPDLVVQKISKLAQDFKNSHR